MSEYRDISFNPELLKIEHFKHYPQMIPFVGKKYKDTRLLIIAESHYLPESEKERFNTWYDYGNVKNSIPETWNDKNNGLVYLKKQVDSFNSENYENKEYPKENWYCWVDYTWTAKIVAAVEWNNRGHKIYQLLRRSVNNVLSKKNNRKIERLEDYAFMNFFQRPAKVSGKSIQHDKDDIKVAGDTLQTVCKILKPTKIFFVSQCAWENFCNYINNKEKALRYECGEHSCNAIQMIGSFNNSIIGHGPHPCCPMWNTKYPEYTKKKDGDNNTGKEAFEYFISDGFLF